MSAGAFVADLRERGVELQLDDTGLVCHARRGILTPELKSAIRENKAVIERALALERAAQVAARWGDLSSIAEWFLTAEPPVEPFLLKQGVDITDPAHWWKHVAADVAAGPDGPRARHGALQDDLWRAWKMFGPSAEPVPGQ